MSNEKGENYCDHLQGDLGAQSSDRFIVAFVKERRASPIQRSQNTGVVCKQR